MSNIDYARYNVLLLKDRILSNKLDSYCLNGFHALKSIYVHIPKTGGVSINRAFFSSLGGGHKKLKDYKNIFSNSQYETYFKFTIVRNPLDRFLSAANYVFSGGAFESDRIWLENYDKIQLDINKLVSEDLKILSKEKLHFLPQYQFVIDEDGIIGVDFVGKFEEIDREFAFISKKIGAKKKMKRENSTTKKLYKKENLDSKSLKIIQEVYEKDFQLFNYNSLV